MNELIEYPTIQLHPILLGQKARLWREDSRGCVDPGHELTGETLFCKGLVQSLTRSSLAATTAVSSTNGPSIGLARCPSFGANRGAVRLDGSSNVDNVPDRQPPAGGDLEKG